MHKERINKKVLNLTELAVLLAIIVIMGFTPIGYIKAGIIEFTLITVPVIIGAMALNPASSAFLGLAFGVTSFLQCVLGASPFGVALLEINPLLCFLVCVPTRALMGWFTGLFFKSLKKKTVLGYAATGLLGSVLNTFLFMSTLLLCFWRTDFIQGISKTLGTGNVFAFTVAFVGTNGVIEAVACTILSVAVGKALNKWFQS